MYDEGLLLSSKHRTYVVFELCLYFHFKITNTVCLVYLNVKMYFPPNEPSVFECKGKDVSFSQGFVDCFCQQDPRRTCPVYFRNKIVWG